MKPAAAAILEMFKGAQAAPAVPPPQPLPVGKWTQDYPVIAGTPMAAAAGGALGLLYHLVRKQVDKKYKDSFVVPTLAGAGAGALGNLAYQAATSPNGGLGQQFDAEVDKGKYDRVGPLRNALRLLRPVIPTREGHHDFPEDFKKNVTEPLKNLPSSVALGGRLSPQETRIGVSSPKAPAEGFWRKGFAGNKPKEFFTLDEPLEEMFGPPEHSSSYTGSETLGTDTQYDYNGANAETFKPDFGTGIPLPKLKDTDRSVLISGHGSGEELSAVAGRRYVDILKDLAERGHLKGVTDLTLQTCNTEGCDVPKDVIAPALGGNMPRSTTYTPPGAVGMDDVYADHLRTLRTTGANGRRLMDSNFFAPRRVTTLRTEDDRVTVHEPKEPAAAQTMVRPVVPPKATQWMADKAGQYVTPALRLPVINKFVKDPDALHRFLGNASKTEDFVKGFRGVTGDNAEEGEDFDRSNEAKTLIPSLRGKTPKDWFPQ